MVFQRESSHKSFWFLSRAKNYNIWIASTIFAQCKVGKSIRLKIILRSCCATAKLDKDGQSFDLFRFSKNIWNSGPSITVFANRWNWFDGGSNFGENSYFKNRKNSWINDIKKSAIKFAKKVNENIQIDDVDICMEEDIPKRRVRRVKRHAGELASDEPIGDAWENYRVTQFLVICTIQALNNRFANK